MIFEGYACVTNTPYDMGCYSETVTRGAFTKTLAESPDVVLNISHGGAGSGLPVARTKAGTMTIAEDLRGLKVEADLDDEDPDVLLISRKMQRGDLDGQMSFAFQAVRQSWNDDYSQRSITEANIDRGDVSIVVQGANPATSSSIRSALATVGKRASRIQRRQMAGAVSTGPVVLSMRSFTLGGITYEVRDGSSCNRCAGEGSIVLQGQIVNCPQCRGVGDASGNATPNDEELSAWLAQLRRDTERDRWMVEQLRKGPLSLLWRSKYSDDEIDTLGRRGYALRNGDGSHSWPIADEEDLRNAVRAVWNGSGDEEVRRFAIGRASALGLSSLIPDTWNDDGSLKRSA